MPASWRPVAQAAKPCAPSCAIVTTCRATGQAPGASTSSAATATVAATTPIDGGGCSVTTRCQTSRNASTGAASRYVRIDADPPTTAAEESR